MSLANFAFYTQLSPKNIHQSNQVICVLSICFSMRTDCVTSVQIQGDLLYCHKEIIVVETLEAFSPQDSNSEVLQAAAKSVTILELLHRLEEPLRKCPKFNETTLFSTTFQQNVYYYCLVTPKLIFLLHPSSCLLTLWWASQ